MALGITLDQYKTLKTGQYRKVEGIWLLNSILADLYLLVFASLLYYWCHKIFELLVLGGRPLLTVSVAG